MFDYTGNCIDRDSYGPERTACHVHRLLGQKVAHTELNAPVWFELCFDRGDVLRIRDDSNQYESFSIQPGNIFV